MCLIVLHLPSSFSITGHIFPLISDALVARGCRALPGAVPRGPATVVRPAADKTLWVRRPCPFCQQKGMTSLAERVRFFFFFFFFAKETGGKRTCRCDGQDGRPARCEGGGARCARRGRHCPSAAACEQADESGCFGIPTSMPGTVRWQRREATSSGYARSLARRATWGAAPTVRPRRQRGAPESPSELGSAGAPALGLY